MASKRVFKTATFDRWARGYLTDAALCIAAGEIEAGNFEADLGGGICKKRIRMPGQGKSGSTRTLVAIRNANAIFFLAGREKSRPGHDFTASEVAATKILAKGFEYITLEKLNELVLHGVLKEICHVWQG